MNLFTFPLFDTKEEEIEELESEYSFFTLVEMLKEVLLSQKTFTKDHSEYMNVYTNLMHYIRKHSIQQSKNLEIRDKDFVELRNYKIIHPKLEKMIEFMWEETNAFPEYLTISIVKGWIVNMEFEYMTAEEFMRYLEIGLQIDINEIIFLIRLKEKKTNTLSKDERRRLLSIHEMIRKRTMLKSDDETTIIACIDRKKRGDVIYHEVEHSSPEEDAWLLRQIQDRVR
jgi:hypothetical protein